MIRRRLAQSHLRNFLARWTWIVIRRYGGINKQTSMSTTRDPITATQPLNEEERVRVIGQMEKMVANPLFSESKRYAPFLRHVVQKTLDGQEDSLKERLLGVEVFGRAPDYDSNNDPVV